MEIKHIEFGSDIDSRANDEFISENNNFSWAKDAYTFQTARSALIYIAKKYKMQNYKRIFMPQLYCESMVTPFLRNDIEVIYYPILPSVKMDTDFININIKNDDLLLVNNYLSLKTREVKEIEKQEINLLKLKYPSLILIQDYTQSLYDALNEEKYADYSIFSIRKWAGLPESGLMWCKEKQNIEYYKVDNSYYNYKKTAMDLKSKYLETHDSKLKEEFMKLFKKAEEIIDESDLVLDMKEETKKLIRSIDFNKIYQKRFENMNYFIKKVNCSVTKNIDREMVGLYCPILINNSKDMQAKLAKYGIYCPVIWNIQEFGKTFANSFIDKMLAVPVDQRYSLEEIDFIAEKINSVNLLQKNTNIDIIK